MFVPVLVVAVITGIIYYRTQMTIGKQGAYLLIATYVGYLAYVFVLYVGEKA